jgi:hypothetical protein
LISTLAGNGSIASLLIRNFEMPLSEESLGAWSPPWNISDTSEVERTVGSGAEAAHAQQGPARTKTRIACLRIVSLKL